MFKNSSEYKEKMQLYSHDRNAGIKYMSAFSSESISSGLISVDFLGNIIIQNLISKGRDEFKINQRFTTFLYQAKKSILLHSMYLDRITQQMDTRFRDMLACFDNHDPVMSYADFSDELLITGSCNGNIRIWRDVKDGKKEKKRW